MLEAAETIGGGTRTGELTVPGVLHDHCSAVHPMAVGSPFLNSLDLERHGLEWLWPEVDLAHPLDDGTAGVMVQSIDETAEGLGEDGAAWRRIFGSSSANFEALNEDMFRPVSTCPSHPIRLDALRARRGGSGEASSSERFKTPQAKALFGGVAAHAIGNLDLPMSSSVGTALICACHAFGWAVAKGGSASITTALAGALAEHGGKIETGVTVRSLAELPDADAVVFDLAPPAVADIAGDRLPSRVARAYRRYKFGPGAFKVDLAVEGGVPWRNEACRRAGTVHAAGTFEEVAAADREVAKGRMPERPYVLVAQQYLADPSRSNGDVHPVWSYAHVPNGYTGDATEIGDRPDRALRPGAPRADRRQFVRPTMEFPDLQRELRRRRHHHRRQHAGPGRDPPALRPRPLQLRSRRALHVLGRDAARRRRPRDERLQRGAVGAQEMR